MSYTREAYAFYQQAIRIRKAGRVFAGRVAMRLVPRSDAFMELPEASAAREYQLTDAPHGHVLTNSNVWSPDGHWIVYDVRPDPAGNVFEGERIEMVHVKTGEVRVLYECEQGARCGVSTFNPCAEEVVFIRGPERPTPDWGYSAYHREGVVVKIVAPGVARSLDARDIVPPFTAGALRGGTHVHVFSPDGQWVSFTYEDHVLALLDAGGTVTGADRNQRQVGVSAPIRRVNVPRSHLRHVDGSHFSVVVTRTCNEPRPGSDQIQRAFEEAWVGSQGYIRADGSRQSRALAFQGQVITDGGQAIAEVYIVDVPDDITQPGDAPLQGTATTRPSPPHGTVQRRLTHTSARKYPGIQGPRHWLRSSPDGERIAFLMKDDDGVVQMFTVSPRGGSITQLTRNRQSIESAFTWTPDGRAIACIIDGSVCLVDTATGETTRLTTRRTPGPRPEACVVSPDGRRVAFVRSVASAGALWNQVMMVDTT